MGLFSWTRTVTNAVLNHQSICSNAQLYINATTIVKRFHAQVYNITCSKTKLDMENNTYYSCVFKKKFMIVYSERYFCQESRSILIPHFKSIM